MTKSWRLRSLAVLASTTCILNAARPNILFIFCDDLGYGDVGVFFQNQRTGDRTFATPQLDQMAAGGVQLRAHYCSAPVCAPSRASLFLGVHQGHANIRNNQFDKALENNHTLANVLKEAGYATSLIGKWGLQGSGANPTAWPAYPTKRGFDYFFGYVRHGDGHTQYPFHTTVDPDGSGRQVRPPKEVYEQDIMVRDALAKCYTTDMFTARAKQWIIDHRTNNPEQPFFLFLSHSTPHAALQVPTTAYPAGGGVAGGLQWLGTPGQMINTAVGDIDSYIHPDFAGKSWTNNEKRFATMVRRIDDSVGDLLQTLVDLEIDNNTLVVFTSDNGPHHESYFNEGYEANSFHSFGPFDGTKRDCWEGGVRVPTIAHWPGTIPPGRVSMRPGQFHDWLPTFTDIAGLPAPARSDGVSLVPDMTGADNPPDSTVYIEYRHEGRTKSYGAFDPSRRNRQRNEMQVVFRAGYKGVRYDIQSHDDDFEIYDVAADPKESNDLANGLPEVQQEMKNAILRLRRPNASAARPYDDIPIPAVRAPASPGLKWALKAGSHPWVAGFGVEDSDASGITPAIGVGVAPGEGPFGITFSGYLLVPEQGEYTFFMESSSGAHLRIHDAAVIDDDFTRTGGEVSASIQLAAGLHPLRLHHRHADGTRLLAVEWSGPGIERQPVPAGNLYHFDAAAAPMANPDQARTPNGEPVRIPVLDNDIGDDHPETLLVVAVSQPLSGTAAIDGDAVLYTPAPGFFGIDHFTYTISNGTEPSTASVSVDVYHADGDIWYSFNQTSGAMTLEAGGGYPATLYGFAYPNDAWIEGKFGRGITLNGTTEWLQINNFPGLLGASPRTCAAWIRTTASGNNMPILAWGPNANGEKWTFMMDSAGRIRVEVTNGWVVGTTAVNDGQWHHVACTFGAPQAGDLRFIYQWVENNQSTDDGWRRYTTFTETRDGRQVAVINSNPAANANPGPGWSYFPTGIAWQPETAYLIDFLALGRTDGGVSLGANIEYGLWAGLPDLDGGTGANYNDVLTAGQKPGPAASRPSLGTQGRFIVSQPTANTLVRVSEVSGFSEEDERFVFVTGPDVSALDEMVVFIRNGIDGQPNPTANQRLHWTDLEIVTMPAGDLAEYLDAGQAGVTSVRLYVNGARETLTASSAQIVNTTDGGDARIGSDFQGRHWQGELDEVRILNRALKAWDILAMANPTPPFDPSAGAWWRRYFGNLAVDWSGDPDGDGFSNFAEYAFGGQPLVPHSAWTGTVLAREADGTMELGFRRRDPATSDILYQIEMSDNLSTWEAIPAVLLEIGHPDANQMSDAWVDPGTHSSPNLFFRVKCTFAASGD